MRPGLLIVAILASCLALPSKHSNLKIYSGNTADPGQFPFVVAINSTSYGTERCAGSIINENWILTTARCGRFYHFKADELVVISGTNRLDTGGVVYNLKQIVVHPNWTGGIRDNIALYQIDGSFTFSDLVQPVKFGAVAAMDSVVVIGWGFTTPQEHPPLQYAHLTAWSNEYCREFNADIHPGEVCTIGPEGIGLCRGDEGAPLVLDRTLVGLGTWLAIGSCGTGMPDIYTRVSYYEDWINDVIKS